MTEKIDRYNNYDLEVRDGKLIIMINLNEDEVDVGLSKSEKSMVIATTGGIRRIPKTALKISMTIFRKAQKGKHDD